ncbi:MAG: hypothetical protein OXG85_11545 [Chloroflexi bacterium]|nr:hypothetical protein [Chloroflexota bacterium]
MSKPKPTRHAPGEVDDYLEAQAPEFRVMLEELRAAGRIGKWVDVEKQDWKSITVVGESPPRPYNEYYGCFL